MRSVRKFEGGLAAGSSDTPFAGWRLRLDRFTRRIDGGRVLVGGAPFRVMRLSAKGKAWIDGVDVGELVPDDLASSALARRLVDAGIAHPIPPPDGGPTASDVAVVIPVKDDPEGLRRTLTSLGAVGAIVVVDDGSADHTPVPRAASSRAVVLRHERAQGPGAARQDGWQVAAAELIAFVDADVVPEPDWLERLLPHFADPTVVAVAPRIVSRAGEAPQWLAAYEAERSPLDLGADPSAVRPGARVPYVPTAVLVVRREALEAVGGFDTSLRFGEDVDLVWRLDRDGARLRYEPTARASHPARSSLGRWLRQRFDYGSSAAALADRHGDAVAPLRGLSGWSALAWGALVTGHRFTGVAVGACTTAALVPKLRALDDPVIEALRIAGLGHLWAGRSVADAIRRTWWPAALVLAIVHRRSRPALLAALVVPPLVEWREARPAMSAGRYVLLRALDDLAYGAGVWWGCARARSVRALAPAIGTGPVEVG